MDNAPHKLLAMAVNTAGNAAIVEQVWFNTDRGKKANQMTSQDKALSPVKVTAYPVQMVLYVSNDSP